jgi:hypothetical protein
MDSRDIVQEWIVEFLKNTLHVPPVYAIIVAALIGGGIWLGIWPRLSNWLEETSRLGAKTQNKIVLRLAAVVLALSALGAAGYFLITEMRG